MTKLTEAHTKGPSSPSTRDVTLGQLLEQAAQRAPDRLALIAGVPDQAARRRWTYKELYDQSVRAAKALRKRFKPGERVAVWAPNIPEWVMCEFGCAMAGVVLVDEKRVDKPSETFEESATVRLKGASTELRYVGRGGLKLEAALRHLAPKLPPHEFGAVIDHARDSKGLRSAAPETAVWLSLVAYARHVFSEYDDLLAQGYDRESARHFVMDEIAALTPTFAGVSYAKLDELGSVQWPCNEKAPEGTPVMHIGGFVRGKGKFVVTEYIPTDERTGPRYPLLLTTGRILSQYNVGAQTRRTENVVWHDEDRLEIHPHDAEQRGVREGDWVRLKSRAGETTLRADITDRVAPGVVYTTFHHPDTQANVITTEYSDWATNCPEYKVTAVQISPSNGPSDWQKTYEEQARHSRRIAAASEAAE